MDKIPAAIAKFYNFNLENVKLNSEVKKIDRIQNKYHITYNESVFRLDYGIHNNHLDSHS